MTSIMSLNYSDYNVHHVLVYSKIYLVLYNLHFERMSNSLSANRTLLNISYFNISLLLFIEIKTNMFFCCKIINENYISWKIVYFVTPK